MNRATKSKDWGAAAVLGLLLALGGACDSLDVDSANSVQSASKSADDDAEDGAKGSAKGKASAGEKELAAGATDRKGPGSKGVAPGTSAPPVQDTVKIQKALVEHRGCVFECMDGDAKETDRETCKLTCRSNADDAGLDLNVSAGKIADRFELCAAECADPKLKKTDRETCKLNCGTVAETLEATLEFSSPTPTVPDSKTVPQGCAVSCMQQMSKCERLCDEQPGVETDRETCRLLCGGNGELCIEICNAQEAARQP